MQIKSLAAELCLDRADVLQLLREPPPNLLMMSATLPDKPVSTVVEEPVKEPSETISLETTETTQNSETKTKVPVHVMQSNWSAQKRIKKVQLDTLERVYGRTKRPTVSELFCLHTFQYLFVLENRVVSNIYCPLWILIWWICKSKFVLIVRAKCRNDF